MTDNTKIGQKLIVGLIFFISAPIIFLYATENYNWGLKSLYEIETTLMIASDYDKDGIDEIIEGNKCYVFVKDQNGFVSRQFSTLEGNIATPLGFFRLNDTLPPNLFVCVKSGDTVSLRAVFEKTRYHRAFIGKDIRKTGISGYDGTIRSAISADINGDGFNEIICRVNTGFDLYPRGIFVYDYKNNRELWHYWIGCNPSWCGSTYCIDIDNDGKKEIFFGTDQTSNGALENGLDDLHPWVIALNSEGKLLWQKKLHNDVGAAEIYVGAFGNSKEYKVVVCESRGISESDYVNQLMILNAEDGQLEKYIQTGRDFLGMAVCDLNRDGKMEIITGNSDGIMRIFDCNLEMLNEKNFGNPVTVSLAEDLDGDGRKEILLTCQDSRLVILDERLQTLCDFTSNRGGIVYCFLARDKHNYRIITAVSSLKEFIFTIYRIDKTLRLKKLPISLFITIVILLLALSLIFLIYRNIVYRRRIHKFIDESPASVIVLNQFNKITYYNNNTRKIIGETKDDLIKFTETKEVKDLIEKKKEQKAIDVQYNEKNLNVYFSVVGKEKLLIIADKTSEKIAKELISWSGFAQRLAHEIKNPLSTINLTLQRMYQICHEKFGKKAEIIDGYAKSVLEEVERLRKTTDRFMRVLSLETPKFSPVDINGLLNEILKKYEDTLPREIQIKRSFAPDLPLVRCDEGQITTAFSNIIENAIEAMKGKGLLSVRTAVIEAINEKISGSGYDDKSQIQNVKFQTEKSDLIIQKFVEIRFEDTGKGFSEEETKNLFKPFFSTKKNGTGLGLVIAQKIMEIHNGKIEITSKKDIGTVVIVTLPLQKV
ncbi:MAG: ATP-binding protein [bacterium]